VDDPRQIRAPRPPSYVVMMGQEAIRETEDIEAFHGSTVEPE